MLSDQVLNAWWVVSDHGLESFLSGTVALPTVPSRTQLEGCVAQWVGVWPLNLGRLQVES